jgi:N-formylglutamate amidohydrolase
MDRDPGTSYEPIDGAADAPAPSFDLRRPTDRLAPLVYASPHSGREYPAEMMAASVLDERAIRRSEDAFVDDLIAAAPTMGVPTICARLARAFMDVNREAFELDPGMFADELPDFARARTARVAAGLGAIARVVSEGQEIYGRKLTFAEAAARIDQVHRPYHATLTRLLDEAQAAHGFAILVDWHSMPAAAARQSGQAVDIVLGDRFGAACSGLLTARAETELKAMGYRVTRNAPYAGGYTTEHYGRPARHVHALQIEINRALYLDETKLARTIGFSRLQRDLNRLTATLAGADWTSLH